MRQSEELRVKGEALIRQVDKLTSESWNERRLPILMHF
jgi:hypothetical protein